MTESSLTPHWRSSTADYPRLDAFRFDEASLRPALVLLCAFRDGQGMPFRNVGEQTVFVPVEATETLSATFDARNVSFSVQPVARRGDLSREQMSRARLHQLNA